MMHEFNSCRGGCVSRKVVAAGVSACALVVAAAADCGLPPLTNGAAGTRGGHRSANREAGAHESISMELIRRDCNGKREIAPALRFDSEFRFERVVLLEFAYAKDAEADDVALLVHPLHNGVILRLTHVSRRIREDDFEKVASASSHTFTLSAISLR
jgi:hypothetical protein